MRDVRGAWGRLRGRVGSARRDADVSAELEAHLDLHIEEQVGLGVPRQEARRQALLGLGGLEPTRERMRDERRWLLLDGLSSDIGYALRGLRRAPGFTAVAVATIALGVGASTAIFAVVDAVLLRPLNFAEPHRLAMVRPSSGSRLSPAYLHDWRLESTAFRDLAGWHDVRVNLTDGEPAGVLADRVTSNFFAMLGAPAMLGRTFTTQADLSQVESEVVLSHGLWQRRYGSDPGVIGRPIVLDGRAFTVVGVMPGGFAIRTNELAQSRADLWLPLSLVPGDRTGMGGFLNVVGRLAAGASPAGAEAELGGIARRIERQHPSYSRDWGVQVLSLQEATVKDVRLTLVALFGAVGVLLLIACANVANLVLSRVSTRQAELGMRLALGATAARLVRQFMTEGFLLAAAGGAAGVLLAVWGTRILVAAIPAEMDLPSTADVAVDLRVAAFAIVVTALAAILFGLVPLAGPVRSAGRSMLREATPGLASVNTRSLLRNALLVSEMALATMLLAAAGLVGRSFWELIRVDPGFRADGVLTMRTTLPQSRYDNDDRIRLFGNELFERVGRLPGVEAVGSVNYLPLSRFGAANRFEIEGRPDARIEDQKFPWVAIVGGRYFDAMGIPLLRGRLPGAADTGRSEPVFVIDDALARRHWGDADPIGARISWQMEDDRDLSGRIVGVVGSVRWRAIAAEPPASAYWWFPNVPDRELTIVLRTAGDQGAVAKAVSAQIAAIDPSQPVAGIRPMQDLISADLARPRVTMVLIGVFAAAAALLAAIGLYGVATYFVTRRTHEIGMHVALGAGYGAVVRLVMRQGVLVTGAGLVVGIVAALALGRTIGALLYGIAPADPLTLAAVSVFLAAVALLAMYLPARRAALMDPMRALRTE